MLREVKAETTQSEEGVDADGRGCGGRARGGRGRAESVSNNNTGQRKSSPPEDVSYTAATGGKVIQEKLQMPGYLPQHGGLTSPDTATFTTMSSMTSQQQSATSSQQGGSLSTLSLKKGAAFALKSSKYSTPSNQLIMDAVNNMEDDDIFNSERDSNAPGLVLIGTKIQP